MLFSSLAFDTRYSTRIRPRPLYLSSSSLIIADIRDNASKVKVNNSRGLFISSARNRGGTLSF